MEMKTVNFFDCLSEEKLFIQTGIKGVVDRMVSIFGKMLKGGKEDFGDISGGRGLEMNGLKVKSRPVIPSSSSPYSSLSPSPPEYSTTHNTTHQTPLITPT
jgi:hypothetical protein